MIHFNEAISNVGLVLVLRIRDDLLYHPSTRSEIVMMKRPVFRSALL